MNVVLQPALASLNAVAGRGDLLCLEGTCLFGWAWTLAALTLLSAWVVRRRWPAGGEMTRRLMPAGISPSAPSSSSLGMAFAPRPSGGTPAHPTRTARATARSNATGDLAAACSGLRASPTTDMAAGRAPRLAAVFPSPPPRLTRSTGTPTAAPAPAGAALGQRPPA
jgi:hypothetical protein